MEVVGQNPTPLDDDSQQVAEAMVLLGGNIGNIGYNSVSENTFCNQIQGAIRISY